MRFLWLSRDCERIVPRPRGVSSCRIQDLLFHVVLGVCSAWVEVLDHTHWAWYASMWDLRCMMLPPPSVCVR